jgi:hypothetical protein
MLPLGDLLLYSLLLEAYHIADFTFRRYVDEITGMAVICEYSLLPVDICTFSRPRFLPAWLSQT